VRRDGECRTAGGEASPTDVRNGLRDGPLKVTKVAKVLGWATIFGVVSSSRPRCFRLNIDGVKITRIGVLSRCEEGLIDWPICRTVFYRASKQRRIKCTVSV